MRIVSGLQYEQTPLKVSVTTQKRLANPTHLGPWLVAIALLGREELLRQWPTVLTEDARLFGVTTLASVCGEAVKGAGRALFTSNTLYLP
jgi:hypothetical protein